MNLVYNPRLLTTLCAQYYIKHKAISLEDEFYRTFVKQVASSNGNNADINNHVHVQSAPLDVMTPAAKDILLDYVLENLNWGLLDMYVVLNEDIVELDVNACGSFSYSRENDKVSKFLYNEHTALLLKLLRAKCPKLKSLSLNFLKILPKPLQLFIEAMPHMATLNLSGVLCTARYDGVLKAISENMPNLKALDISRSCVQDSTIELLLPTKENPPSGCTKLAYLNLAKNSFVTVELLKKIILRLPKLRYLKHALLMKTLTELTEGEMDENTGRCLRYFHSEWLCDCCCNQKYYDAFSRAPALTRLGNIEEVDIIVIKGSEHFLRDILMQFKKIKRLTLHSLSESHKFLLPVLESNGGCLEYLHLHDLSGGLNLSDIMRTCPGLVDLTVHCNAKNESHKPKMETSTLDPVLTCIRKFNLQFADEYICSKATLVSLLKSPCLEKIYLFNVDAMFNDVINNYLSFIYGGFKRSTKLKKIILDSCPNITEKPFVHWLSMKDCMLEFIFIQCPNVNYKDLKTAVEKYTKALSLFAS